MEQTDYKILVLSMKKNLFKMLILGPLLWKISKAVTENSKVQYLLGIPFAPDEIVVKYYFDMVVTLSDKLGLNHAVVHANEAIKSKINIIMWLNKSMLHKILPIPSGFHTLLIYLNILYKKYGCPDFQDW